MNLKVDETQEKSSLKEDYDKYVQTNYNELTDLEPLSDNLKNEMDEIGQINNSPDDSLDFKIEFESKKTMDENKEYDETELLLDPNGGNGGNGDNGDRDNGDRDNGDRDNGDLNNQTIELGDKSKLVSSDEDEEINDLNTVEPGNELVDEVNNFDKTESTLVDNDEAHNINAVHLGDETKHISNDEDKVEDDIMISIDFKDNTNYDLNNSVSNEPPIIQMIDNNETLDVETIINKEMIELFSEKKNETIKNTSHNKIFGTKNLNDINNMTIKELQNIARENKLKVTGKKDALVERVKALYNLHSNMHP